jgi:hypothetical protein
MNPIKHFIKKDNSPSRSIDDDHKAIEGNNSPYPKKNVKFIANNGKVYDSEDEVPPYIFYHKSKR